MPLKTVFLLVSLKSCSTSMKSSFLFIALFLFLSPVLTFSYELPLLWDKEITEALNDRDYCYQHLNLQSNNTTIDKLRSSLNQEEQTALRTRCELLQNDSNPWYYFLSGILSAAEAKEKASEYFALAIKAADKKPGSLWVLFMEFHKARMEPLATECLSRLEKYFLASGAQSASVISGQLLVLAKEEKKGGNRTKALQFFLWSKRFERHPFWQNIFGIYAFMVTDPGVAFSSLKECFILLQSSWSLQLSFLYYLYAWIKIALIFFSGISFLIISIEALPTLLHRSSDIFYTALPSTLRYLFCIAILIPFSLFGIVPFIFIFSLLYFNHVESSRKVLLWIVIAVCILSPVDARIQDFFNNVLSPKTPLGLYRKAAYETSYPALDICVLEAVSSNPNDYLTQLTAAIIALKKEEAYAAKTHIAKALRVNPSDPVVLTTAGAISFLSGEIDSAHYYFTTCIKNFPQYESAYFNLGQTQLSIMNAFDGTDNLKKASILNPIAINSFMEKNDSCFANNWPKLRQLMQTDYKPAYFFIHVLPRHTGSWQGAADLWGAGSYGLSPLHFLLITFIIMLLRITIKIKSPIAVDKIFYCSICGSAMCKKCRVGPVCGTCNDALSVIQKNNIREKIKTKIIWRKNVVFKSTIHLLNFLFPGAGYLYQTKTIAVIPTLLSSITSFVYALYLLFFTTHFSYPFWVAQRYIHIAVCLLLVYTITFAILSIRYLYRDIRALEVIYGSQRQSE